MHRSGARAATSTSVVIIVAIMTALAACTGHGVQASWSPAVDYQWHW
jgi:hypothetical protein